MSLGLTLDSINIFTCDEHWEKRFLEENSKRVFKKMNIQNFFVYFNSEETFFLRQTCSSKAQFLEEMRNMIQKEGIQRPETSKLEYLLNFSTNARLIQTKMTPEAVAQRVPQFNVEIVLDQTSVSLSKNQLKRFQQLANLGLEYTIFQVRANNKYEFYSFRPTRIIRSVEDEKEKGKVIKQWWKFAIKYAQG